MDANGLWIGGAALGVAAALAVGIIKISQLWIRPPRLTSPLPSDDRIEEVRFRGGNDVELYGRLRVEHESAATLIMCNGYATALTELEDLAALVGQAGFNTLLFDFRAHGRSGGRFTTLGLREVNDLIAAVDLIEGRLPCSPIIAYGVSMGGSVVLAAAAGDKRIRAVVADCAFASLPAMVDYRRREFPGWLAAGYHLSRRAAELQTRARVSEFNPVDLVHLIEPRPVLLMHSEFDVNVPPQHFYWLLERLPAATERWLIPACGHVAGFSTHRQEYLVRLLTFVREAAKAPSAVTR